MNELTSALSTRNSCLDGYYSLITSYLGPNKSCKFVGEDSCKTMVCCTAEFIRYFNCSCCFCLNDSILKCELRHPVNHLVSSTLQSHHSAFGCSSATLLSMFYFWHQALFNLKNEGINIGKIILNLMELLENAIDLLDSIIVPFHCKVRDCFHEMQPEAQLHEVAKERLNPQCAELDTNTLKVINQRNSRHFMKREDQITPETSFVPFEKLPSFNRLVSSLGHSNNFSTDLLTKAWSIQINDRKPMHPHNCDMWRFDISQITTLTVNSLTSNSKVVNGILLQTSHEIVEILSKSQNQNIRTLLINGNITPAFLHKGVNLPNNLTSVTKSQAAQKNSISEKSWASKTLNVLKKLDVGMILVSGKIDQDIATHLNLHKICVLCNVGVEVLNTVTRTTGASIASYITDCDELNVATCLSASIENTYNINSQKRLSSDSYIILHLPSLFQTIVICHPVSEYLSCLQHSFWHVAHRLAHATESDKLLPGGSRTEEKVVTFLQLHSKLDTEFLLAKKVLTDGFQDFINAVKAKLCEERSCITFQDVASDMVYDDYISKIESWRSALRLACLVNQTDLMIITGDVEICNEHVNHSISGLGQL